MFAKFIIQINYKLINPSVTSNYNNSSILLVKNTEVWCASKEHSGAFTAVQRLSRQHTCASTISKRVKIYLFLKLTLINNILLETFNKKNTDLISKCFHYNKCKIYIAITLVKYI